MKSGIQKRKEKAQQQFQSSAAKSREPTEFFVASITPIKPSSALLVIIRQSFLSFAAANLLNISSKYDII